MKWFAYSPMNAHVYHLMTSIYCILLLLVLVVYIFLDRKEFFYYRNANLWFEMVHTWERYFMSHRQPIEYKIGTVILFKFAKTIRTNSGIGDPFSSGASVLLESLYIFLISCYIQSWHDTIELITFFEFKVAVTAFGKLPDIKHWHILNLKFLILSIDNSNLLSPACYNTKQ